MTLKLSVATRGSQLSLAQVKEIMDYLSARLNTKVEYEPVIVKSLGDVIQDRPLRDLGVKGIFEKEVNRAVLEGKADVAVHSMKDLPSELTGGLEIALVPPRQAPNDSLVFAKSPVSSLEEISKGAVVGTSSIRRKAFLLHYNDGVIVKPIRGNVDTRLKKLNADEVDYIILAEAGLRRLGLNPPRLVLPVEVFPPEPAQGLLAVVAPRDSPIYRHLVSASDPLASRMAVAEREFVKAIGAGCHVPIGGVAIPYGAGGLMFIAASASEDGSKMNIVRVKGSLSDAEKLGAEAAERLRRLM